MNRDSQAFLKLLGIMNDLREKCPWDRKQTLQSLRPLTLEESYELVDEIILENAEGIKEELGDLLLHIVFYSKIMEESNRFGIAEVIESLCDKLIRRHPHIYGDLKISDAEEVKQNWEKLKLKEGKKGLLEGVPNSLPSLLKAYRMQDKARQVGFEWPSTEGVMEKMKEELEELNTAITNEKFEDIEEEYGDVLFSWINFGRYLGLDPDLALEKVNRKFKSRFEYMEAQANVPLSQMSLNEMEELWVLAKQALGKADK